MTRIDIDELGAYGYYLSVEYGGEWLHGGEIDKVLKQYSDFTYEELALKFGAYIEDSDGYNEVYFEDQEDAERLREFLLNII